MIEYLKKIASYPIDAAYLYYGTRSSQNRGDRGGSVLPKSLRFIDSIKNDISLPFQIKYATSDEIFQDYITCDSLPFYKGELQMDVHGTGCLTSRAMMKKLNRECEQALLTAEASCAIADWAGTMKYPKYQIDEGWKRILTHQFHDDITGTSIDDAYKISYEDEYLTLHQTRSIIHRALESVSKRMDTTKASHPLLVFNPTNARHRDLIDYGGNKIPCTCEPYSVMIIDVEQSKPKHKTLKVGSRSLENSCYKILLDEDGDISSIFDKRYSREIIQNGERCGLVVFDNDSSLTWPSWEILKSTIDRTPRKISDSVNISIYENHPHRISLRVTKKDGKSSFIQTISLTDGGADDRIDVHNEVYWYSRGTLLKANFPICEASDSASYDLGLGHIRRGINTTTSYEVVGQRWADQSADDGSYGVTILNDCKYGWDKPDRNTLRLTLIHTPITGTKFYDQGDQDLGAHSFTYSIIGHKGELDGAWASDMADELNFKKTVLEVRDSHRGDLGKSFSMIHSDKSEISVKALKMSDDGSGLVVRTYELSGKSSSARLSFPATVQCAYHTNGLEDIQAAAMIQKSSLYLTSRPFQPQTIKLSLEKQKIPEEDYQFLELPYDCIAISSNNFYALGRMGSDWKSYASEIIPKDFSYCGIPFKFGEADYPNGLRCRGQVIDLPQGCSKLYLLAAASDKDCSVAFKIGENTEIRFIPHFTDIDVPNLKDSEIAYIGTHRHDSFDGDDICVHTYMYQLEFNLPPNTGQITLPRNSNATILSATVLIP